MDQYEHYRLVFEHFKNMENRYHTWMNYYSLFNGALLVAYCTVLVSTGKIVVTGGEIKEQIVDAELKIVQLDCTYWEALILLTLLGCVAGYFWYLFLIGHCSWLNNWRVVLKSFGFQEDNILYIDEKKISYTCCGRPVLPHFHSTAKLTKYFVACVLWIWIIVCIYSYLNYREYKMDWLFCFIVSLFIWGILIFFERAFIHYFIGSDLSNFKINFSNRSIERHSSICNIDIKCLLIMLLTIFLFVCCISCYQLEKKEKEYLVTLDRL